MFAGVGGRRDGRERRGLDGFVKLQSGSCLMCSVIGSSWFNLEILMEARKAAG